MLNDFCLVAVTGFVLTVIFTACLIPVLRRIKFGQSIRDCGPRSHLKKSGTPTMGGIGIVIAVIMTAMIFCERDSRFYSLLLLMLGYGLIGFFDDYIKVVLHRNLGLSAWQKLLCQMILAGLYVWLAYNHQNSTDIWIPGFDVCIDIGRLYYALVFVLLVGTTNAVNLTDGLDGLVSAVSVPVLLTFGFCCAIMGYVSSAKFAFTIVGCLLGFLIFNKFPAKVFMGDTGSLALGGSIGWLALVGKCEMLLIVAGAVYVVEAISVILQVASFKMRHGKRIFRMAPLHHHFELDGWSEVKIVTIFMLWSCFFCFVGILLFLKRWGWDTLLV